MMLSRLVSILSLMLLTAASTSRITDAQCTTARVRRSWTSLSDADRQLYKDAIAAAMDSGAYIKFVEIHTEMMSEMEAHRQCMFVYWHRLFLAAFENMLRGQGSRFACVTVPYWDWITDYTAFSTGTCANMLDCSPALQFLGGRAPVSNGRRSVTINGEAVSGYCEADAPMNRFCQNSQVSGSRCARCLPRDDWSQVDFPASASFASVRSQLFGARNIGEMSTAIEQGVHNNIHGSLGATMATFESPADPVFWSHHATVDLLHSIFHKCKVGEQKMTFQEKVASVDWTSCGRRNGGRFRPTDSITMRTGYLGRNLVRATQDARVGRFFSAVPQQFAALVDIRDLGNSSYSYQLEGLLGSLYTECGAVNGTASRQLQEQQNDGSSDTSNSAAGGKDGYPTSPPPATMAPLPDTVTPVPDTTNPLPDTTAPVPAGPALIVPPSIGSMINVTVAPAAKKVRAWLNTTDKLVKRRGGNAVQEAEKLTCLFQDECLGGVTTYTPEFKQRFRITGEPRCKQIIDRIYRGVELLKVTEWKTQMVQTFGCPKPKSKQNQAGGGSSNPAAQRIVVTPPQGPPARTPETVTTPCPNAGATPSINTNSAIRVPPIAELMPATVASVTAGVAAGVNAAAAAVIPASPGGAMIPEVFPRPGTVSAEATANAPAGITNGGSYVNGVGQQAL